MLTRARSPALLAALLLAALLLPAPAPVAAGGHGATRTLDAGAVEPGAEVTVTIEARDFGPYGKVTETLPEGWTYGGSSLPEAAVRAEDGPVEFFLLNLEEHESVTFTYTVTAPDGEDTYTFSGEVQDSDRAAAEVGGDGELRVGEPPDPSDRDLAWNGERDLESLDGGNERPTGLWGDGSTLWIADGGAGDSPAVYAYDLGSGERLPGREFALDETNRAPRGLWADGGTMWASDGDGARLFAYGLDTGERLPARDIDLDGRNADPRGIWGGGGVLWVLDGGEGALFAYDLGRGALLAEYALDEANDDPRGIWSDGFTAWVSDHAARRLLAYRLPAPPESGPPGEPPALERAPGEDFTELTRAGNNSPRGIWSDGGVIYVADEGDGRVYTYNVPAALDTRLASLALSGVEIGDFSPGRRVYEGALDGAVAVTTVTAEALQPGATVAVEQADHEPASAGHQLTLVRLDEITVTVTSPDGSRTRPYVVRFPGAPEPWPHCLAGAVAEGLSLVVHEGGTVYYLEVCAEISSVTALYTLVEGEWASYILGAPEFVNRSFREAFPDGLPRLTPLVVASDGPPSADRVGDRATGEPWPECLRGEVASGFGLVVYEGGSVEDLAACLGSRGLAAAYTLHEGEWTPYIVGAPDFVNRSFRGLFGGGLPAVTPLIVRRDDPSPAGEDAGGGAPARDAAPEQPAVLVIGNTGGVGVSHRSDCSDEARLPRFGWDDGQEVEVVEEGAGRCAGWLRVRAGEVTSWVRERYLLEP